MPRFIPDPDGFLPQDLFDELGVILGARYEEIELEILAKVNKYAQKIIDQHPDDVEGAESARRMHDVQQLRLEAIKEIRRTAERAVERIREENLAEELVKTAAEHGTAYVARTLPEQFQKSINPFPVSNIHAITALELDLRNRLEVLNQRILRYPQDLYQQVIAETAPLNLAGVLSSRKAQKKAVAKFLSREVDGFRDKSGRNWRIGTYAEMAGRTATQRAWNDATVARIESLDIHMVTAIVGYAGCEYCSKYGGRILSTDGTPAGKYWVDNEVELSKVLIEIVATLDEARQAGFQHPNCRCTVTAYIPGLTEVPESTYDPDAEAESREHRELERKIREAKRDAALATDPAEERELRKEIAHRQATLRDFLNETGRDRSPYREQLHFADGGSTNPRGYGTQASRYISKASYEYATAHPPAPGYEPITAQNWQHILTGDQKGGGHRYGAGRPNKTEFPKSWNDEKIYDTVTEILNQHEPVKQTKSSREFTALIDGINVHIYAKRDGENYFVRSVYPLHKGPSQSLD